MRGLVTWMTGCSSGTERCLTSGVAPLVGGLLIVRSRVVPRAAAPGSPTGRSGGQGCRPAGLGLRLVGEGGQAPAPAGQFPGDGYRDHGGSFVPGGQGAPAVVQATVGGLAAGAYRRGQCGPAGGEGLAGCTQWFLVMPGGLDQQAAGVGVTGLGDRTLAAAGAARGLAGDQAEVGADAGAGEPVPVADLHGQPEPGQGGDPAHRAQPGHDRRPLRRGGGRGDRLVEALAAGGHRPHPAASGVGRRPAARQPDRVGGEPPAPLPRPSPRPAATARPSPTPVGPASSATAPGRGSCAPQPSTTSLAATSRWLNTCPVAQSTASATTDRAWTSSPAVVRSVHIRCLLPPCGTTTSARARPPCVTRAHVPAGRRMPQTIGRITPPAYHRS